MKNNLKIIISCILTGIIVFSGTVYAATQIVASQLPYSNGNNAEITNVEGAINDLYTSITSAPTEELSLNDFFESYNASYLNADGTKIYKKGDVIFLKLYTTSIGNGWKNQIAVIKEEYSPLFDQQVPSVNTLNGISNSEFTIYSNGIVNVFNATSSSTSITATIIYLTK